MKQAVIVLVIALLLAGCNTNTESPFPDIDTLCDEAMSETRVKYGPPEEVYTYTASDYNSEEWWYWSRGFNIGFAWGSLVSQWTCDVTYYTFPPI